MKLSISEKMSATRLKIIQQARDIDKRTAALDSPRDLFCEKYYSC